MDGRITLSSESSAWHGYITWTSTQDVESNSSTVIANLYAYKTDGYTTGGNGAGFNGTLSVGDYNRSFSYTNEYNDSGGTGVLHATLTVTIPHDTNSGVGQAKISGSITGPSGTSLSGKTLSGSQTVGLGTIARASTISLDKDRVEMVDGKLIIAINRKSTTATHNLYYWDGAVVKNWVLIVSGVENSYSWDVPDICHIIQGAEGGTWIKCDTYIGGNLIGSDTTTVTLVCPNDISLSVEGGTMSMGTAKTIKCVRKSSNYTINLFLRFTDEWTLIAQGKIDSFTYTPDYELAKKIKNKISQTTTLFCRFYNYNDVIGTKSITVNITVPDNEVTKPSFDSSGLSLMPKSSFEGELGNAFIRGKTGLQASFTASSEYSDIAKCEITVGSTKAAGNPAVISTLNADGNVTVTAKVTDTRGYATTIQTTIYVIPYSTPKITPCSGQSDIVCERAKATGELNAGGTYLAIKAGKSFSSIIVNGTEQNACTLRYRYKVSGADAYNDWVTLISGTDTTTEVSVLASGVVESTTTSYDVELEAVDTLNGTHTLHFQIMTGHISFVLYDGEDGAGFGKYPEAPHVVDIASHMTLLVRGKLIVVDNGWTMLPLSDKVKESTVETGRIMGAGYRVENGNHVFVAFNCAFDWKKGAYIPVTSVPIPEQYRPPRRLRSVAFAQYYYCRVAVSAADGLIYIEYIGADELAVTWIDGYLDYWI